MQRCASTLIVVLWGFQALADPGGLSSYFKCLSDLEKVMGYPLVHGIDGQSLFLGLPQDDKEVYLYTPNNVLALRVFPKFEKRRNSYGYYNLRKVAQGGKVTYYRVQRHGEQQEYQIVVYIQHPPYASIEQWREALKKRLSEIELTATHSQIESLKQSIESGKPNPALMQENYLEVEGSDRMTDATKAHFTKVLLDSGIKKMKRRYEDESTVFYAGGWRTAEFDQQKYLDALDSCNLVPKFSLKMRVYADEIRKLPVPALPKGLKRPQKANHR